LKNFWISCKRCPFQIVIVVASQNNYLKGASPMRTHRKVLSVLLSAILLFSAVPLTALASGPIGITPFWTNVSDATASLSISSGTATCTARVTGHPGTTRITATVILQRRPANGGAFTNVRTWSGLSSNSLIFTFSDTNAAPSGFTYRLRLDATVTRNGVNESITVFSSERTP
jgi:hypothetical protein